MAQETLFVSWLCIISGATATLIVCQIILGLVFISIVVCNRALQSVSNYLVVNIVLSITLHSATVLSIVAYTWGCASQPDYCAENRSCLVLNYIHDVVSASVIYSFATRSIHNLLAAIFAHNIRLQKCQIRLVLCGVQWLIALLFPFLFNYINFQVEYVSTNYLWVLSEDLSIGLTVYILLLGFVLPTMIILGIHIKLTLFVRHLRRSVAPTGSSSNLLSKHESLTYAYTVFFLILIALSFLPGVIFQKLKPAPAYQYRIYYFTETIITFICLGYMFLSTSAVRKRLARWRKRIKITIHCPRQRLAISVLPINQL